ncbi:TetR/AcrR family transcriptional regulator [Agromyces atrinae]|uniref:AcrR family transcriptional regulator n=1 Tax=Agromyces atrinae TaxID=592376 RepID=A0A4Q2M7J1_9MICO|nr:TetR/AcrR family transcriptional regulator [Agromyces atrinae]NYD67573.1 AcrR family transcriptional regulator [Agromyces atrinae]RXZ88215.1 TetR/AcrR family transcriptional regulator [Agromyces atrinae]
MSDHRQGPVRSEAARIAVLEATARLFATRGYDHMTMEGVAAEAGVSKQTIYRWWPSKGALIADCLLERRLLPDQLTLPDTGDVRADLTSWIATIFRVLDRAGESLLRSLIAAAAENVEVGQRLHASLGMESSLTDRLRSAIDAGELRADAPLAEIGEALVGSLILRALSRQTVDEAGAARFVTAVLGASRA